MCGIAGFIDPDAGANIDLEAMIASLAHRGPDRRAVLRGGRVGLAAARLEIVGAEAGEQPRRAARGSLFAMNGEIYNWRDLDDADQDPESDTAAIHDALEREGLDVLHEVRGGYALAWAPSPDRLILARDPFGQRPLYYARLGEAVVFASEIRALFVAGVQPTVDEDSLAALLRWQFLPPGKSLHAGIRVIRPGEILEIKVKRGKPHFASRSIELEDCEAGGGEDELFDLLVESAWLQRPIDQSSGILLSGGLDSSASLALLDREGGRPDRAYVGWFPEGDESIDERPFARIAAAAHGIPLEEIAITAADFAAAMPRVVAALEEPMAGPGAVSQFLLCERVAREHRVLFAGQGGDELFGGYERLRILALLEQGAEATSDPAYGPLFDRMRAARAAEADDPLAPYRAAVDRGRRLEESGGPRARDLLARAPLLEDFLPSLPRKAMAFAESFEWRVLLPGLLHVDDRCCATFGVEGRSIFLDQILAAEMLAIPMARKSPPEEPRAMFKRLLGDLLPAEILARREKLGFPLPLKAWWRGPLRDFARDLLGSQASLDRGIVSGADLDALLDDDGQGGRLVYFLMMLEFWFLGLERRRSESDTNPEALGR